jgi:hypothetical protein
MDSPNYHATDADGRPIYLLKPCVECGQFGEQGHSINYPDWAMPICLPCKMRADNALDRQCRVMGQAAARIFGGVK